MAQSNKSFSALQFLKRLKIHGNAYDHFTAQMDSLIAEISITGLSDQCIALIAEILKTELAVKKRVALIKCLIPTSQFPDETLKDLIEWFISSIRTIQPTVATIFLIWLTAMWEYELVNKKVMNMYYDCFFHQLMTSQYVTHLSRLIFVMTKPDNVYRRQVVRILRIQSHYEVNKQEWNRLNAVLLIFKTYKPDCVPENIKAINCERAWNPIPAGLEAQLEAAKERISAHPDNLEFFGTNLTVIGKKSESLLPSVSYLQENDSKLSTKNDKITIYDINSFEHLGKLYLNINLPCQAVSLLNDFAGNHLLAFADKHYQNRFMYNLYNTLRKAFIIQEDQFSDENRTLILKRLTSFCQHINEGIPAVNYFLHEYLSLRNGEFVKEILNLMCWSYDAPTDLLGQLLSYIKLMFDESSVEEKCNIFKMLRKLLFNLYLNRDVNMDYDSKKTLFLKLKLSEDVLKNIPIITSVASELAISGLITHSVDVLLLSEILTFYEDLSMLQAKSRIGYLTVAPPTVVYSCLASSSVFIVSRICALILRYDDTFVFLKVKKLEAEYQEEMKLLEYYKNDFAAILCENMAFQKNKNRLFLNPFPRNILDDYPAHKFDHLLSIGHHMAFLPHCISILELRGREIFNDAVGLSIARHSYPAVAKLVHRLSELDD